MPAVAKFEQERLELATVLASGIFDRAPGLAHLLQYVCERYFEGEGDRIKEYNIAVEALGRPASFDQKRDSIVRVEAHLLRKRLKEYYEASGSTSSVHISIPSGQYVPKFSFREPASAPEVEPVAVNIHVSETSLEFEHRPIQKSVLSARRIAFAIVSVLAISGAMATGLWLRSPRAVDRSVSVATIPLIGPGGGSAVRILAGYSRPAHLDRFGQMWGGDKWFRGGDAVTCPRQVLAGTPDCTIYRHCRKGNNFAYDIPLQAGSYELHLYFGPSVAPWTLLEEAIPKYPIMVGINNQARTYFIDFSHNGRLNSNPDIRVFRNIAPASDGFLHLTFAQAGEQFAFLNGIEVIPTEGHLAPVRLTAGDSSYTDTHGNLWPPDRFFHGGASVVRRDEVSGTPDPDLFAVERYGASFDYLIPVADTGAYAITLGFAETWFGPKLPGGGGAQSRLFDVSCNGRSLIKNLDVYKEAGGSDRALVKTFRHIHSDADGKLRLTFTAIRNFALVNFIEVDDETSKKL
jgi:hypothetical protein